MGSVKPADEPRYSRNLFGARMNIHITSNAIHQDIDYNLLDVYRTYTATCCLRTLSAEAEIGKSFDQRL